MTRFMITLEQGVELVWRAFDDMLGGEIYVKKIPSVKVTDLAKVVRPDAKLVEVGIRPGEKLHEQMIGVEDAAFTYEYDDYYKILPQINNWDKDNLRIKNGKLVGADFSYESNTNDEWMAASDLTNWLDANRAHLGEL